MSALLHARVHSSVLCDQRSSHIAYLSSVHQQQLRQNQVVYIRAESSRSGFTPSRQHVRAGRRDVLHSTALLSLPTLSRSDAQTSLQQPLSSSKDPVDSSGSAVSGSQDEEPVVACRPPSPPLRLSAPGRIVAGALVKNHILCIIPCIGDGFASRRGASSSCTGAAPTYRYRTMAACCQDCAVLHVAMLFDDG